MQIHNHAPDRSAHTPEAKHHGLGPVTQIMYAAVNGHAQATVIFRPQAGTSQRAPIRR